MTSPEIYKKISCRVCLHKNLTTVISLGSTPLANAFLSEENVDRGEKYYPLEVYFCNFCTFLQLGHVVSPELLFSDYVYLSSTSKVFVNHFVDFAEKAIKRFNLNNKSLVIDIGSNDGILLKPFKANGIRVLGIEPAKKIAELANKDGVETLPYFMSQKVALEINKKYEKADIITATNVFAHVDDLDELIRAVKIVLKQDGVFVIEVPYLIDFINKKYFDLIYHEHLSYWRIETMARIFDRLNMRIIDVEKVPVHGGSVRVYVMDKNGKHKIQNSVSKFIDSEKSMKLDSRITYTNYASEIEENKIKLVNLLYDIKKSGKKIIGYGAPAKGNTLLNYFNIGRETIDYIIDDSPWKQGLYSPGKRIPIKDFEILSKESADYMFILAWNFSESIIEKNKKFSEKGGKFIIPVPKPRIHK
jgi:SAM-dependent methyltransferase